MTLLIKARQNRLIAVAVKADRASRKDMAENPAPVFRSRRGPDNLNWAPLPLQHSA